MNKRIGIFSGVFDPIHKGHIGVALEAIKSARLDTAYFLVERQPRLKVGITHPSHRIAMLKLAVRPYPKLKVLELPERQLSVAKTLPKLRLHFASDELFFIAGSDILTHLPRWPLAQHMLQQMGLIIAVRGEKAQPAIPAGIAGLPEKPKELYIIASPAPEISSGKVRETLHKGDQSLTLPSIRKYIIEHWLYSAVPPPNSS